MTKYNNRRVLTDDGWFDSQAELRRWQELKLLEKAGKISDLKRQVRYDLIPKMRRGQRPIYYVADFVYQEDGKERVEDRKGFRNRVYMLKWRLMEWVHGIEVVES